MPDMLVKALMIATPVAILAWYVWTLTNTYQRTEKSALLEKLRNSKRYRGITIRNGGCQAVHRFTSRFYRLEDAPELPVEGCKALRCSCTYTGLNNRRYQTRRSGENPRLSTQFESDGSDRRQARDRRAGNNINWQDPAD